MEISRGTMWTLVAGFGAATALLLAAAGLGVTGWLTATRLLLAGGALALVRSRHVRRTPVIDRLAATIEGWTAFGLVCLFGAAGSYALAAVGAGYADELLAQADRRLGLDWVALYRATAASPWAQRIGQGAYGSIFWLPMITIAALVWTGRDAAMRRFVAGYAASLIATLAIFPFFPARSALVHYLGAGASYAPFTGVRHVELFERLRAGALARVNLDELSGMITFPSFHAASALLFIWGAWPVPGLRVVVALVSGAMLLATPIEGTHYFVDVIGGLVVAGAVVGVMELAAPLGRRRARVRPALA